VENFNPIKKEGPKKESILDKASKVVNLAKKIASLKPIIKDTPNVKTAILSKLIDNSKIDKTRADNLYANRILEEELIAPDKSFSGFTPTLPEGTKIIDVDGSHYANIGDKMYYIRKFKEGFDLVDNTRDFIPDKYLSRREYKRRDFFQKKYGLSSTTEAIPQEEFYHYNESTDDLDNWIIHNDMGKINKNKFNKDETWWRKGEPYKAMEARSLIKDKPAGRHLFAKQSALESSTGKPLDEHRELIGDVIEKGSVQDGGITITPTSEADLLNIEGLKSFTYNPITKSMERGIFHNPNTPKDKDKKEDYKHPGWDYNNPKNKK
jgi:hypothetical protein